jgi:hypothetical protein
VRRGLSDQPDHRTHAAGRTGAPGRRGRERAAGGGGLRAHPLRPDPDGCPCSTST